MKLKKTLFSSLHNKAILDLSLECGVIGLERRELGTRELVNSAILVNTTGLTEQLQQELAENIKASVEAAKANKE